MRADSTGMAHHRRSPSRMVAVAAELAQCIAGQPLRAQTWVRHLVYRIVRQGKGKGDEGNADTRRNDGPPGASEQRAIVLGPVQIRAPTDHTWIAEAEELQRSHGADRIDRSPEHIGCDEGGHVREDLAGNDAKTTLSANLGGRDKVPVAQRERLRAQHASAPGPAGESEHKNEVDRAAAAQKADKD